MNSAEAVVRGHKSGLLSTSDYNNLCQCETLEDVKLHLVSTLRVSSKSPPLALQRALLGPPDVLCLPSAADRFCTCHTHPVWIQSTIRSRISADRSCAGVVHQLRLPVLLQSSTDYGPYLANEASPLHTTTIVERCTEKLVDDWNKMRANVSSNCLLKGPFAHMDSKGCWHL